MSRFLIWMKFLLHLDLDLEFGIWNWGCGLRLVEVSEGEFDMSYLLDPRKRIGGGKRGSTWICMHVDGHQTEGRKQPPSPCQK